MKKKSLRGCKKKKFNNDIEINNILLKSSENLNKHKKEISYFVFWAEFAALRNGFTHNIPRSIDREINILNGSSIITLLIDELY